MNGERFDDLARRLARLSDREQSRRALMTAALAGGTAAALRPSPAGAVPAGRHRLDVRNQTAEVDPLVYETAFNLQFDVDKIFQFVRDEVGYDPYAGVLRGAKGTLWGLAGNAADQAVLLAALLNASLTPTRFVIGELNEGVDQRLVESLRLDEEGVSAWAERVRVPAVPEGEIEPAALTADEEATLAGLTKAQERFAELVERQLGDGIETVLGALEDAGIALPETEVAIPDAERTQHVWVQYSNGTEWVDLDPSVPNAEAADVFAAATSTIDQISEDYFHRISMRLVAEKVIGGAPAREEILAFEATSAELVGVPITLMHPDSEALKAAGVAIQAVIGGYRNYIPSLVVGNQSIAGRPVTFVTGDGVLGAFGDVSTEGDTLAEWLEIDIKTPGGGSRIVRELFDRVGLARRDVDPIDLTAIPAVEFVDTGGDAPGFPPLAAAWSIGVINGVVPWGYFDGEEDTPDPLVALSRSIHVYHHVRDVLSFETAALSGQRFFIDEPNLTAVVQTRSASTTDEPVFTLLMDLLNRHFVAVPIDGAATGAQPQVAAGVFSHAVERALVESAGAELLALPSEDFMSVGRVFEEAKRQAIPTVVLRPGTDDPSRLVVGEATRMRIEEALAEGYTVIVPERAVEIGGAERSGWWLVDPGTGATLDQLDDGRGVTMIDYAYIIAKVLICAAAAMELLGLLSLAHTYGAGNQLQQQWARNRAAKTFVAANACFFA